MSKLIIDKNNITLTDAHEIMRLANILYFRQKSYEKTYWMGLKTAKCPMDMWVYQEILHSLSTDLLIETGTLFGGSALFFANLFDIMGRGKIITVDIQSRPNLPKHPRITYLTDSSIEPKIISYLQQEADKAKSVTVILDSDHQAGYKLKELNCYSNFVSLGNYLIAEDTGFDYYPAWPEYGPGPMEAVEKFIKTNNRFTIDRSQEKHLITFSPKAFLKKIR